MSLAFPTNNRLLRTFSAHLPPTCPLQATLISAAPAFCLPPAGHCHNGLRRAPASCLPPAGHFYLELKGLRPGRYHYKFIVDDTWALDPFAPKVSNRR